jgi:hypothetical protein
MLPSKSVGSYETTVMVEGSVRRLVVVTLILLIRIPLLSASRPHLRDNSSVCLPVSVRLIIPCTKAEMELGEVMACL